MIGQLPLIGQDSASEPNPLFVLVFAVLVVLAFVGAMMSMAIHFRWFLTAYMNRVPVTFTQIVGMLMRGNKPKKVVPAAIEARRAGLNVTLDEVENASVTWPLLEAVARGDYAIRPDCREAGKVTLAVEDRQGRVWRVEGVSDIDALARFARGAGFNGTG
ncbi:MAG: hypothetical protein GX616_22735 [Planctomycetes bacterium]|nr:hypothetical protein [Planctomycetota bacterium]